MNRAHSTALRAFGVALSGLLVAVAAFLPGVRLDREVAAARREGLWTEPTDLARAVPAVAERDNAAEPIRRAIWADERLPDRRALAKACETPSAFLRAAFVRNPDLLARWRRAAARPDLDYGRDWAAFPIFYELPGVRQGGMRLVAAARLGISPRDNLLAAARLCALTQQEPTALAQRVAVGFGLPALREARRRGVGRDVERLLGPPVEVRRVYRGSLASALDAMRHPEMLGGPGMDLGLRLRRVGTFRTNAMRGVVSAWRGLFRELPADPQEFEGAARVFQRRWPAVEAAEGALSSWWFSEDEAKSVRLYGAFERERAKVRAGG